MKMLRVNDRLVIIDGRDPLQYVDLSTKKLHKYKKPEGMPPVYIDEASDWPVFKWWRNPLRWYQWHSVMKITSRNTKFVLQTTPAQPNAFYGIEQKEHPALDARELQQRLKKRAK